MATFGNKGEKSIIDQGGKKGSRLVWGEGKVKKIFKKK